MGPMVYQHWAALRDLERCALNDEAYSIAGDTAQMS